MWASALTLAVLPAIWLANRDEDRGASPNVAAVGVPADRAEPGPDAPPASATVPDPLGSATPGFIDADNATPAASRPSVAVGSADHTIVGTGTATYDNDLARPEGCLYNGVATGLLVTVVNLDNGRSVECWTAARLEDDAPLDEVVLSPQAFRQIADPTSAPIHVEIRQ